MQRRSADERVAAIFGRRRSLFADDLESRRQMIAAAVAGARVCVIGAAGSIGAAFVRQILPFAPRALHLVDLSENNLAEVVRDLHASGANAPDELRTLAIGLGSREFERYLAASAPFDWVINFSALKHVRSERDPYTLMRLYQTNVEWVDALLSSLASFSPSTRFFSVSSDKAVEPASLMGASKAWMELVLRRWSDAVPSTTARFANVAFSDGSLLYSFEQRLRKGQPLAAPSDTRRYFISEREAGELCLLACFASRNRDLLIPRLDEERELLGFDELARRFLAFHGYRPFLAASEEAARQATAAPPSGCWPCYFSQSDTSGEKAVEAFRAAHERVDETRFAAIGVIPQAPLESVEVARIEGAMQRMRALRDAASWDKETIVAAFQEALPTFRHLERHKSLDDKM
ncbi:MAG: polysaccharide biosynthesis protein [Myxococcales bacterium]|nr:polysaccharide biosynthesis protein [Myxococcales bacterium]